MRSMIYIAPIIDRTLEPRVTQSLACAPAGSADVVTDPLSWSTVSRPLFDANQANELHGYISTEPQEVASADHSNQQYSITAVTTSAGSVVERYAYSAYGEPTFLDSSGSPLASSNLNQRFTYTGREWDATVGLYHFRARWMSPKTGRFLGRDPIRYRGGIGLYANNFAMSRMDPFGLITARGEITVGQGTLLIGWVMPPDPFLNPAIKAIAWMNGSSDDGCRFSSPVIGDYLLPRTQSIDRVGFNFVTGADKQGPNNFLVDANPECCCPDDKVECSHFYIHMVSGLGFGLEVTGGEGAVTVTGGIQVELLDYYFSLVICADGSATVETVFVRDYDHADASYYVGMKHNANGRQTQYKGLVYSGSNWFPDRDKDITIAYYSSKSGSCLKMADGPLVPGVTPGGNPIPYR